MKNLHNYISEFERSSSLDEYIIERLKLSKNNKHQEYNYHPKTKDELKSLLKKLLKERGNDADLNDIDTSQITDMGYLFNDSKLNKFNGDISQWNVSNVKKMEFMFAVSDFNGDISDWDVSKVEDMYCMFASSKFNGDISGWDVSKAKDINGMFSYSKFNGDISKWDVSNVKDMKYMFDSSPLEKNPPAWYKK